MKISKVILYVLLATVVCFGSQSALVAQSSVYSVETYRSSKGDTLNYRRIYPDADTFRKYPLVVFLHGSGERETIIMPS